MLYILSIFAISKLFRKQIYRNTTISENGDQNIKHGFRIVTNSQQNIYELRNQLSVYACVYAC